MPESDASTQGRAVVSEDATALYARILTGSQPAEADAESLSHLLALGLVRQDPPLGVVAIDPGLVEARWAADLYAQASRSLANIDTVSEGLQRVRQLYDNRPAEAAGAIEYLRGSATINVRLGQVLSQCSAELLVCQPGGPRKREVLAISFERDLAALNRGVVMRTLYHVQARAGDAMGEWVAAMTKAGAEIRTLSETFQRMFIIDRKIAVIPGDEILTTSPEAIAHVVHDSAVATFLARSFERDWQRAEPWGNPRSEQGISERGRVILAALARGDGHTKIAASLGIGKQTLATEIKTLKATFGATTLFELACKWTEALST